MNLILHKMLKHVIIFNTISLHNYLIFFLISCIDLKNTLLQVIIIEYKFAENFPRLILVGSFNIDNKCYEKDNL